MSFSPTKVSDLLEIASGVSKTPHTVPVAEIKVEEDKIVLPDFELELDDIATDKFTRFLGIAGLPSYMKSVSPALRATNLNYWLEKTEGNVNVLSSNNTLLGLLNPDQKALPLSTILNSVGESFDGDDDVVEFHLDDFLHVDIVTSAEIVVPGTGHGDRQVGDITKAGVRVIAYPDQAIAPEVYPYLYRLVCTNGMQAQNNLGQTKLRGNSIEEVNEEFKAIMAGLKIDFQSILDEYRASADVPIPGEVAHFIYNLGEEAKLPRAVVAKVMDLSSNLPDEPTVYDVIQLYTSVANEEVTYSSRRKLQNIGGQLATNTAHMLDRCNSCLHTFGRDWAAV